MLAYLIFFIVLVAPSITIHEISHGWAAYKLGDPTAKYAGRLSFNPLVHIDIFGTILLPLLLLYLGGIPLGFAKPVPVNYLNLRNPRKDMALVSLAGPASNLLIAFILLNILKFAPFLASGIGIFIIYGISLNMVLGCINLVPIPPLDGSRVISALLPQKYSVEYAKIERFGNLIVIISFVLLYKLGLFQKLFSWILLFIIQYTGINISLS